MIINKFLYKLWMLYFDRIDSAERSDINKTIASKACDICHICVF